MGITGIICEYNPLHLGHQKQFQIIRHQHPDESIVCLMSGNFVQRGKPAIFDKMVRAKAALLCGADLVLELPVTGALSSAEGFAAAGVGILGSFCHRLCFGTESGNAESLLAAAQALLSSNFSDRLKKELDKGASFPAARQAALETLGVGGDLLSLPNDILAVEYCKAILSQKSQMKPMPILRQGSYHDTAPDPENPSATAVRNLMVEKGPWAAYVPENTKSLFAEAAVHTLEIGERAILAKLRTMSDAEFESLPYGSEGLWRKFMHACRREATLEQILTATKSKRYTRTRLDRMVMCAFLGITREMLEAPAPYARVLALNDRGREILKAARGVGAFPNIGEKVDHPYQALETRCGQLYGLFANGAPEPPEAENQYRVFYQP